MLNFTRSLTLFHPGDCHILGIQPDMTLYIEEIYGDEDQIAQHALSLDGQMRQSVDEAADPAVSFEALRLPPDLQRPAAVRRALRLNFSGPRHRGLREPERISDVVRALEVPTRFKIVQQLQLDLAPPHLLGIAESTVLAEALVLQPDTYVVCRRLRIAYALPQPRRDAENQLFDYDTLVHYIAHLYRAADGDVDLPPEDAFAGLPGVQLLRPMDCMVYGNHLFVADGGGGDQPSRVHIWQISE